MSEHVLIIGAGIAGLSLARELRASGLSVSLLEKSRGVGGRCATRRVEGQPVDHGVPFLHGRSARFAALLDELEGCTPVPDWPHHLRGAGTPCQPQAYRLPARRLALREGVSALAKHLARGVTVERETRALELALDATGIEVHTDRGVRRSSIVVLTCPVDQTLELLRPLASAGREIQALIEVLRRVFTLPSLTLLAGYPEAPPPDFHLWLPGPSSILHSLIHDSSKRAPGGPTVLVLQGQPGWSRDQLEAPVAAWSAALRRAAGELLGDWAARPAWQQAHRWRYARVQRGGELSHPVLLPCTGGGWLGLCGEALHPAGGLEGAFLSGIELAGRIHSATTPRPVATTPTPTEAR